MPIAPIASVRGINLMFSDKVPLFFSKNALCRNCGKYKECGLRRTIQTVKKCAEFSPMIRFRTPLTGTDGVFNTLRLGSSLARRLYAGCVVTLVDPQDRVLCRAETLSVEVGPKEEIAELHAKNNHNLRSIKIDERDLPELSLKRIRRLYGGLAYEREAELSAIYLRVI